MATFNSAETPSLFLHPANAIHGDPGMIQKEDLVICISRSGNTPEIKVLVPVLKRRGSKLVALVSNTNFCQSDHADCVLNPAFEEMACPDKLAPMTGAIAQTTLENALTVCQLELRTFFNEDFAMVHPDVALGKQSYLKVDDIYTQNELPWRARYLFERGDPRDSSNRLGAGQ